MKLNKLFLGAIAALASAAMVACSDDAPDINNGGENGDGETSYLAVNIVPTSTTSRGTAGNYEDGTDTENKVEKVRFYFFNAGGDPATVKSNDNPNINNGNRLNYFDWDPADNTNLGAKPNETVEKTLKAIIVINTKQGDGLPGMILAVVNPDKAALGNGNLTLTNLRNMYADFASFANDNDPVFVMSNSVYREGNEIIKATKLVTDNFKRTATEAETAPVKIYVERTMAKVRAQLALTNNFTTKVVDGKTLIPALSKNNDGTSTQITITQGSTDVPVYIKLLGWNVTTTLPNVNLSKHISPSWLTTSDVLSITWNDPNNHRSYWADVQNINGLSNSYIKWSEAQNLALSTTKSETYVNENAQKDDAGTIKATQIIVGAQICDENGNALTICEYGGMKFADNATFDALKAAKLTFLNNGNISYYKKVADNKYTKIGISDIEIIKSTGTESNTYSAKAQLTTAASAETIEWYSAQNDADEITDPNQLSATTAAAINTALAAQSNAMIYLTGNTYYYKDIEHVNRHGVVRNHIYDITINGFYGLGTPVYNPDDITIPEPPLTQDSFLAAEINILQWRVMNQSVTFE